MPKKRVSVLYEIWWPKESPEPPRTLLGKRPADGPSDPEPDVHEEVYDALGRIGYSPQYAVLEGDVASLAKMARARTSLVFNLTESYAGDDTKDLHVAAFLELLGKPFTGCDARALHLGQDKALAKKILCFHGIPTPDFVSVARGTKRIEHDLPFPLIVKPSLEDGSIGIDTGSVVHDDKALRERVRYIYSSFAGPALVERYVEGREIYVAIIGNDPPEALPLVELDLSGVPHDVPRIAGTEVKWWKGSEDLSQDAADLPEEFFSTSHPQSPEDRRCCISFTWTARLRARGSQSDRRWSCVRHRSESQPVALIRVRVLHGVEENGTWLRRAHRPPSRASLRAC